MPPENNEANFSPAEYERAYHAYGEWKQNGHTELTCVHCGRGGFQFSENGNSAEIRCNTPNCVVARIRGI